ncbi:hypothetical protein [Cryptosporangium minutisporangium]|uniref:Uncharacterized protein n=1 Tax=Cryptosporangium minutisporangium TaxID=113569 RepID=A0ABP6TCG6_9ACTN
MNELDTRALLGRMAAEPAPPTRTDIDGAIATARRQRQRTRWVVAAAAATVLILTVGLVTILRPEPQDPAPTATPPAVAPTKFDPTRTRLDVGWLPEGMRYRARSITADVESLLAAPSASSAGVNIQLTAKGFVPTAESENVPGVPIGEPVLGPEVNGAPSRWYPGDAQGGGWLHWEWAPGALAVVEVYGRTDARDVATRIARSVRADRERPVALPFTMARPDGTTVVTVGIVENGSGPYTTWLEFARARSDVSMLSVMVLPRRSVTFTPDTVLGARPADEQQTGVWYSIRVELADDVLLEVKDRAASTSASAVDPVRAQVRAVAAGVQLSGDLSDPSTWSKEPLR